MATAQLDTVVRHLRRAVLRQDAAGRTDGQLLASFIEQNDEAAFDTLIRRHGPMVFGVCCRIVRNHHDAEDAFQATFLVLARKASSVRPRERVANWLHGVALRTAMRVRTMTAKRRGREKQGGAEVKIPRGAMLRLLSNKFTPLSFPWDKESYNYPTEGAIKKQYRTGWVAWSTAPLARRERP